jgi:quercetin dioxygenase-like cupin family protein
VDVRTWDGEPFEELNPAIGRQTLHTENMTIARVRFEQGAEVAPHEHENEQVVMVLEGSMRFKVGDEEAIVSAGQSVSIPSNLPHSTEALEASLVLDFFSPRREDWIRGDDAYLRG